ncbi:hypothetical protein L228DRAFT_174529 [Xylona heveae TC161]|uniref:F-box domain-containing protein n=1 Tax=Xylona heveae (strain CBS 132557 / TC161) TaxID=1328760 RepID=A0A165AJU3_XYLHT|nr:hypothetical protein L228DRAFT_174529 [Xylona heveae TC161]KZF20598.1 hypothetical protein L228DRAFT_174529 [Xylona heveae TC161]
MVLFENLATELLVQVFRSCNSLADIVSLSSTCRRFHNVLSGSHKLQLLAHAAEAQYGPLEDAIQVVTHNASQPAHMIRQVPISLALLRQIVAVGRVAVQWEDIYPLKKWKHNYEERRLLEPAERRRFRRALYRLWLYTRAFHNRAHPRETRLYRPIVLERAALLHNWTTAELADIEDVREIVRDVLQSQICPSNGTIQRKFRKRFPDTDTQLLFNVHLNYPPPAPSLHTYFTQPQSNMPSYAQATASSITISLPSQHESAVAGTLDAGGTTEENAEETDALNPPSAFANTFYSYSPYDGASSYSASSRTSAPASSTTFSSWPPPPLSSSLANNASIVGGHYAPGSGRNTYFSKSPFASRTPTSKYRPTPTHEPGAEGWGDEIPHYYVVEDMLKLDPAQILYLRSHAPFKRQVEQFVRSLGDWFENNGETFSQTLEWVLDERGTCVDEFRELLEGGDIGVVGKTLEI